MTMNPHEWKNTRKEHQETTRDTETRIEMKMEKGSERHKEAKRAVLTVYPTQSVGPFNEKWQTD
jgi:hypothetical protein